MRANQRELLAKLRIARGNGLAAWRAIQAGKLVTMVPSSRGEMYQYTEQQLERMQELTKHLQEPEPVEPVGRQWNHERDYKPSKSRAQVTEPIDDEAAAHAFRHRGGKYRPEPEAKAKPLKMLTPDILAKFAKLRKAGVEPRGQYPR